MKTLILFSVAGLLLSVSANAQSKANTNREVLRTYASVYLDQRNYPETIQIIEPYLREDNGDYLLWNYLGVAQMELAQFAVACESLANAKRLAPSGEERIFVVFNLADCLNRNKEKDRAVLELQEIASGDSLYARSAESQINLIKRGAIRPGHSLPKLKRGLPKGEWHFSGAIAGGFDTNVLLVEEAVINSVGVSDRGSAFLTPAFQAGYSGYWNEHKIEARYLAAFTDYLSSSAQSFNNLYQRADFRIGSGPIQWGLFSDVLFLNRSPFQIYNWDIGASWNHTRKIDASSAWIFEVPVRYQKYPLDASVSADNDRTGAQFELRATYRTLFATGTLVAQGVFENQYTIGKNYRLAGLTLPVFYTVSLPGFRGLGLTNSFNVEFSGDYYWQSDTHRRDATLKWGAGLAKKFGDEWSLGFEFFSLKNISTISTARYSKQVYSLLVAHDF